MLSYSLFTFGPFSVSLINLILIALIALVSIGLRRVIHRKMKQYLLEANIRLEGRRATWLRLLSQSVYILSIYVGFLSFRINNPDVSLTDFLNYNLVESKRFTISFSQILLVTALFIGAKMAINLLKLYYSKKFNRSGESDSSREFIYIQVSKYIIYIFTFYFVLDALEIDLKLFLGGSAALLVGLGLGLQDVFKDMFSGLVLLFEGTLKIGDVVELQDSKFKEPIVAKILKINVRTTQIETRDGNVLMIPNAKLTQEYIENWSHGSELSRFSIDISVAYSSDTILVMKLLRQATLAHPKVKNPSEILVRLKNFGSNGLEFEVIFWADQSWEVNNYKSDIRLEIDRLFRQHHIVIPFPQMDIQIKKEQISSLND